MSRPLQQGIRRILAAVARSHLCLDVRGDAVYWALAHPRGRGMAPRACGIEQRVGDEDPGETLQRVVQRSAALRCETTLRSPDIVHQAFQIPPISRAEAKAVARRRAHEVTATLGEGASFAHLHAASADRGAIWLAAAPAADVRAACEWWVERGVEIGRLTSRQLALGQLVRALPEPEPGTLIAILDLAPAEATCVFADRNGWVFGREVPLRFLTDAVPATPVDGDPQAIVEATVCGFDADGAADTLEVAAELTQRISLELRRTFHYVENELGLGSVTRLYLSGTWNGLEEVRESLASAAAFPVELLTHALAGSGFAELPHGGAVAAGLALSPDRTGGDLLPHEIQAANAAREAGARLGLALAACLLLLFVVGTAMGQRAVSLVAATRAAQASWETGASARKRIIEVRGARRRAREIDALYARILRPQPSWTALLETLGRLVPNAGAVQRLSAFESETGWRTELVVEATGDSVAVAASAVSQLAQSLDESPLVSIARVEREDATRSSGAPELPRVRFRFEGALATVSSFEPAPPIEDGASDG